jgi:hypothetical protein
MNDADDPKKRLFSEKLVVGTVIGAAYFAVLVGSLGQIGLTDDVEFYSRAALKYQDWWGRVLADAVHLKFEGFSRQAIDNAWTHNHEHPPFAKLAMAGAHAVFYRALRLFGNVDGLRMGTILLSTILALFLFSLAWDQVGRAAALFAPLALLTMPRFFFHSHAETLDVPVAATFFVAFFCFWRARESWRWAIAAGVAFGAALSTKLNAPFLLAVLLIWWGVKNADDFTWAPGHGLVFPRVPLWIPSMIVLGGAVFFLMWPWIWFETHQRLNNYIGFHLKHYGILFSYFGTIYDEKPFAPWHAPWVMAGITTPPLSVLAGVFGTGVALFTVFSGRRAAVVSAGPSPAEERRDFHVLILLCALMTIGTVSFLPVPKYGGVKLFLPFFPFFALLGGVGVQWVADRICGLLPDLTSLTGQIRRRAIEALVAGLLIVPAAVATARVHPYHLSYYNAFIGGLPGAAKAGMERQYYDVFYKALVAWMNVNLPRDAQVHFLPNNKEYVRSAPWYRMDGVLRKDIRIATDLEKAGYLVLTHEERWREWPELQKKYGSLPSLYEIAVEGVPLLNVYKIKQP